ncbi:MAG: serine/threonine protein kinase [Elusimicrobia bacterium]|nr:serine/threonine protein kinase [Elusimicrobiota bacterium]
MQKIKPGYILDNKYEIKEIIAKGAMGAVYKAEVKQTKEIVALKVPLPEFDRDLSSLQRFRQSEKIQFILAHPNIVKAFKPQHEKSSPYLVMEYINGPSLEYLINHNRRLSLEDATNYTIQMCGVIDYLQQNKVIHHDIKPSNIVVNSQKQLKLTDFGIAFCQSMEAEIWASLVSIGGTLAYMAPEKIRDHALNDYRSDIYSLGVLMYHMFTGKLPFNGSTEEVIGAQITQNFLSPSVLNPQITPTIERVILKAMEPNPNERYQHVMIIKEDLERAISMSARKSKPLKITLIPERGIPIWILYVILGAVILAATSMIIYVNLH